ncbi:hypothetical protein KJ359_008929 [Pestalotiopsis sp. 9143b]|nr:hypothetical protein KJ359_008929 [Pestalotiopsis sp. 9143b]
MALTGNQPSAVAVARDVASPQIGACSCDDPSCNPEFWSNGGNWQPFFTGGDGDEVPDEQNPEDEGIYCPITSSTSTTTTPMPTPMTIKEAISVPSPAEDTLSRYNSRAEADHIQVDNAIHSFCRQLEKVGVLGGAFYYKWSAAFGVSNNQAITIDISVEVNDNCEWTFVSGDCQRYLDIE